MSMFRQKFKTMLVAAILACVSLGASADEYPTRPIKLVVPFPAGSSTDLVARTVASKMSEGLGKPIVIENKLGAGGNIATQGVALAKPDGYTLLMGTVANATSTAFLDNLNYDFVRDFIPVSLVTKAPFILVSRPDYGPSSLSDMVVASDGGEHVKFGFGGLGTAPHLTGAILAEEGKLDFVQVPYKGGVLALTDLMGGQIDVVLGSLIESQQHVQSGELKAIAVTSLSRVPALPDVPAVAETFPGFEGVGWHGILAPTGTDESIIARLNKEISEVLKQPDLRDQLNAFGAEPVGGTSAEFAEFIKSDIARWRAAVKSIGGVVPQ